MRADKIKKDFEFLIKNKALSHGYIFHGEDVSSQFIFAKEMASYLEKGSWEVGERVLSDARFLSGLNEKLGIDKSRSFVDFLYQFPVASENRVLVVEHADKLTPQAQNALLKITEEPPRHSLIILCLRHPGTLISPLVSRMQKIYFSNDGRRYDKESYIQAKDDVERLLAGSMRDRSSFLKDLVKEERISDTFITVLMEELLVDKVRYARALKELAYRNSMINTYNVNKKLQLEAVMEYI
ncbi:MAG: hypothetical protein COU06_01465 [Candidatus Harrisonbacteria bacterium CG10_big_fil_rev_8_21_14_0_10_38_8]|uniref:DNA polymerase III subunit delta n=1 Tax=Candidatus Harrisonbacteria bacterium CG10_big_fil_rev_8_21_14_0_10_38_8 TaxID=1974582 RepID=A0A2M6WK35_9BACT|nr:MAG: hypothetical protein COU06_01465 [Candidatus Harrisonbacteria bacterium CG10_big_fil_rev_8_21_14_0_10_38_8]